MTVRQAREFGARAIVECRRIFNEGVERLASVKVNAMTDGSIERMLGEAVGAHADTMSEAELAVVHDVITAGASALRRMAARPDRMGAVIGTIQDTARSLDGIQAIARAQGPDAVDGAARSVVADFVQTYDGDPAAFDVALDQVPSPIVGTPSSQAPAPANRSPDDISAADETLNGTGTGSPNDATNRRFSMIAEAYCASLDAAEKPMSVKDCKRIRGVLDRFIEWAGDVSVAECRPGTIKRYAADLAHLPSRATNIAVLRNAKLTEMVAYGRANRQVRKVSKTTIANGYVAFVRSAMTHHCEDHGIPDPFGTVKIDKGTRALKVHYRPLPMSIVNDVIAHGTRIGGLTGALLPIIGLLTTRRLAVLTYLHGDWLERIGDHWVCRPRPVIEIGNEQLDLRSKNGFSLLPFAVHDTLVELGIVDHMREHGFLFGPSLTRDSPEGAMSKRMGTLLRSAGAGGRAKGQVFHSLRANGITIYRQHVSDIVRHQSGHAPKDDHENYDFGELTNPADVARAATVPLPSELDISPLVGFDLRKARAIEERMSRVAETRAKTKAGHARRGSRGTTG